MRIKLERSEDGLQSYARQSGLLFTAEKNSVSEEKLRQLQQSLSAAQADRVARQSRFEVARNGSVAALSEVSGQPGPRETQAKLTDLQRQMAELRSVYTPEHYKVKRIQAQIASLEESLRNERAVILTRISNDYDEAQRRERLLAADYAVQARLVSTEAGKAIRYNILKREVDTNRQLYEAMLQRVKESSIASAMRASNVRVVDAAIPPQFPFKPRVVLNAMLGLLGGLFAGVAFIVAPRSRRPHHFGGRRLQFLSERSRAGRHPQRQCGRGQAYLLLPAKAAPAISPPPPAAPPPGNWCRSRAPGRPSAIASSW